METDINRMLLKYEQLMRKANHDTINPKIDQLAIEDLEPIAELVARARAEYLQRLYDISHQYAGSQGLPCDEEMAELAKLRGRFIDLVEGSKSFEVAIQRGYLDLKG